MEGEYTSGTGAAVGDRGYVFTTSTGSTPEWADMLRDHQQDQERRRQAMIHEAFGPQQRVLVPDFRGIAVPEGLMIPAAAIEAGVIDEAGLHAVYYFTPKGRSMTLLANELPSELVDGLGGLLARDGGKTTPQIHAVRVSHEAHFDLRTGDLDESVTVCVFGPGTVEPTPAQARRILQTMKDWGRAHGVTWPWERKRKEGVV